MTFRGFVISLALVVAASLVLAFHTTAPYQKKVCPVGQVLVTIHSGEVCLVGSEPTVLQQ
jgi:hypothetical protein